MLRCRILLLMTVVLAGSVAGCTRDVNPVRDTFVSMGVGAKIPPAPDFVVASRRAQQEEYIPVGIRQPPRKYKAKTQEQIDAVERRLDAVREHTLAKGRAAAREGAGH